MQAFLKSGKLGSASDRKQSTSSSGKEKEKRKGPSPPWVEK